MRILYVVGDPAIRLIHNLGYNRHVVECVRTLEGLGHEVSVLTAGGDRGERKAAAPAWARRQSETVLGSPQLRGVRVIGMQAIRSPVYEVGRLLRAPLTAFQPFIENLVIMRK